VKFRDWVSPYFNPLIEHLLSYLSLSCGSESHKEFLAEHWQPTPVILATWEAEIRKIAIPAGAKNL
jgi:hypothetical protein